MPKIFARSRILFHHRKRGTNHPNIQPRNCRNTATAAATETLSGRKIDTFSRWDETKQENGLRGPEWKNAKPFDQIPGYRSMPLLGTTWVTMPFIGVKMDKNRSIYKRHHMLEKFGPIWRDTYPGLPPIVTTTRPEDAEKLFRVEGRFPVRPGLPIVKLYRSKRPENYDDGGVLVDQGEPWWKLRSKAQQPLMKTKNIINYIPDLGSIADEFIARIRMIRQPDNEMKPDFLFQMYRWTLESVALIALDTRLGCLKPDLPADSEALMMIHANEESFKAIRELDTSIPIWKFMTTPTRARFFKAQDTVTMIVKKYIEQAIQKKWRATPGGEEELTILQQFLSRGMNSKDVTAMLVDLLSAGIDTTAHTTSFLLYFLARNPEKQEKLRKEILSVIGPKGKSITPDTLNELNYLKACIKESLRMRPSLMGNSRVTDQDVVMSGYRIPKGTLVVVSHQLMGEMEEYFPRPLEFIPERWIKGDPEENKNYHPFTSLPFGFGPRMCIGRRISELEMWQFIAKVMQNFRVEYHHEDIGCFFRLVNTPNKPLRFKFIDLE